MYLSSHHCICLIIIQSPYHLAQRMRLVCVVRANHICAFLTCIMHANCNIIINYIHMILKLHPLFPLCKNFFFLKSSMISISMQYWVDNLVIYIACLQYKIITSIIQNFALHLLDGKRWNDDMMLIFWDPFSRQWFIKHPTLSLPKSWLFFFFLLITFSLAIYICSKNYNKERASFVR